MFRVLFQFRELFQGMFEAQINLVVDCDYD
jgi:hypothetical protein